LTGYGAALQGLIGSWVALIERERSGLGQIVTVSLAAGAAMFWGPFWMKAEKADAGFAGITRATYAPDFAAAPAMNTCT